MTETTPSDEAEVELERDLRFRLWIIAIITTVFMFVVMIVTPREDDNVRKAVYGDQPFGLPWRLVHIAFCVVICAPLPLCIVSSLMMLRVGAELGVRPSWLVWPVFVGSYRALATVSELRGLFWRVTLTWAWFFGWFVWWIVLTSILGV